MPKGDEDRNLLRFTEGHMNQRMENGKLKKRWVVFLGNQEEGHYQLKIYKTKKEKHTSEIHVISQSTYVGTEKGGIYCNKRNGIQTTYWAVILKSATVIFQDLLPKDIKKDEEITPMEEWYKALKSKFSMENWAVNPLRGVNCKEDGTKVSLTLYVTKCRVGLVMTAPPLKCCDCWDLNSIKDSKAHGNVLLLYIEDSRQRDLGALTYHEVQLRMPTTADAKRAKEVIERLVPETSTRKGISLQIPSESERYQPSPTAPRRGYGSDTLIPERPVENNYGPLGGYKRASLPLPPLPGRHEESGGADTNPYSSPYTNTTTYSHPYTTNPYDKPYDTAENVPSTCDDNGYLLASPHTPCHKSNDYTTSIRHYDTNNCS